MSSDTPVVILNMRYTRLGTARSLQALNVPVIGLSVNKRFPGNRSKWCRFRLSPDSKNDQTRLLNYLIDVARTHDCGPILLPTRDRDVLFINESRELLQQHYLIPQPCSEVLNNILSKETLSHIADRVGVKCPRQYPLRTLSDLPHIRDELKFPCVAKPTASLAQ